MIEFQAIIEKFKEKGEKSGWTYISISQDMIEELLPGQKKSFRVKGELDHFSFKFMALLPMGDGSFILPLNAKSRKEIKKGVGDGVLLRLAVDNEEKLLSPDFIQCLEDEPAAFSFFNTLPKGHQRYFSNWIESAKTEPTKVKRITQAVVALGMGLGFSEMMRMNKKNKI